MSKSKSAKDKFDSGEYTLAEYKELLTQIARGEITETKTTAKGELYEVCPISERRNAGKDMATLNGWIDEAAAKRDKGKGAPVPVQYIPGSD